MKDFTKLLEDFREKRQMTKKELAVRANLSAGYISLLTRGDRETPSEEAVQALADALNLEGDARERFFKAAGYSSSAARPTTSYPEGVLHYVGGSGLTESALKEDWGDAPDVRVFHGRQRELGRLTQWMVDSDCQVVAVLGIGGVGKTTLAAKLATQIKDEFEYLFWRSLQNAPPLENILKDFIQFLFPQRRIDLPEDEDRQIALFIDCLRDHSCLLILDNFETILRGKERAGQYQKGYEGYGRLIQRLGEIPHRSCLLLTSREKPREVAYLEGIASESLVRCLQLSGLEKMEGQEILRDKGLNGSSQACENLIKLYSGNPLALKLVSAPIREVFRGDIDKFLEEIQKEEGKVVFGDIYDLLHDQFSRLSEREQEILYWLAIEREAVSLNDLRENIARLISKGAFLETLESLRRRSMIESIDEGFDIARFTLQPVILEYVTDRFVKQVCEEIESDTFKLFASHALIKAQSKDYVRESQVRFILEPIAEWLNTTYTKRGSEEKLRSILSTLRGASSPAHNYVAGNVLNLLVQLNCDLRKYDFSHIVVWQAYLRGVALPEVNFAYADLTGSVFTDAFGTILSVALSPDGKLLAAGTANGEVRLWEAATGTPVRTCQGHSDWVYSVAFSPDGRLLASGGEDQTVRLWDVSNGQNLKTLHGHTNRVWSVAFSPDGALLTSGSHDETVRLWEVSTGNNLRVLHGDSNRVWSVDFSPDGVLLASGSDDETVRLWEVSTGECIKKLHEHTGWVRSVAFSPDGVLLASASDDETVRLWEVSTGECIKTLFGHGNRVRSVAFSPDSSMLASSSDDQAIRLWNVNSGQTLRILEGHTNWVGSVAFSSDGQTLASCSDDQTVRLWEVNSGERLKTLLGYALLVESVTFSPDGRILASGGDDQCVRLWDMDSRPRKCFNILRGHGGWIRSVAFSPDGDTLASCGDDQTIRLWSVSNGQHLRTLRGHSNRVWSLAFSPDGRTLASGSEDQTVRLWNVSTGRTLRTLTGHTSWVWSVTFNPDGHMIASGSADQTIRLWEVSTGKVLKVLRGHDNRVWSVAFSSNGDMLASGSEDQTVRLWNVSTGQELKILQGHSNLVWSVDFSPDGRILASGSSDQKVHLWEVSTGQLLKVLNEHLNQVRSVAFRPGGVILASGSHDGTVKLWNVNTDASIDTLRSDRPYEGMDITGVAGLTEAQKATLGALGAIGYEE